MFSSSSFIVPRFASLFRNSPVRTRSFARFARLKPEKASETGNKPLTNADLVDRLDSQSTAEAGLTGKDRSKLSRGLEQKAKSVLSGESRGILDDTAEEILEHMTAVMESHDMKGLFRGVRNTTDHVYIEDITVNQDYSHITAWWSSPITDKFAQFLKQKNPNGLGTSSLKFLEASNRAVTAKLQLKEGFFRSKLVKKMEFRKMPRIYFRPMSENKAQNTRNLRENKDKQSFLRDMMKETSE